MFVIFMKACYHQCNKERESKYPFTEIKCWNLYNIGVVKVSFIS